MRTRLFFFSLHQAIFELHGVITMRISYDKLWNTMYHMFSSERRTVELICNNSVMDAIIDRFGEDVTTYACDMENFRAVVEVAVNNVLFSWIVGFGGLVKIKSPEGVKDEYADFLINF